MKVNQIIEKFESYSFSVRLCIIIFIHFIINIFSGFFFIFDDFSTPNQITHSIIHFLFFLMTLQFLLKQEEFSKWGKILGGITLVAFIILNLIPFSHGLEFHDNGWVPMWAQAPQTNFGWPNAFIIFFSTDLQNIRGDNYSNPLIHYSIFFLNLYIIGLLISTEMKVVTFLQEKFNIGN